MSRQTAHIIIKKYDIVANIITGNIENIQSMQVGSLIIKISGDKANIDSAIKYLNDNNVKVEVLKNGNL
jgi:D-methionine transport system ATP-binding protein